MPAARLHSLNRDVDFIADIELGANNNFVCKRRGACNTSPLWPPFHRQSRRYSSVAPSKGLHRRAVTSAAPHGGHSIPDYSYPSSATTSQSDLTPSYSWGATTPTGGYDGPSHNTTQGSSLQVPHNLTANDAWSYYLEVVQNPLRTAEFGNASLSRLPLSPPLIVQLVVRDRTGKAIYPEIETPFLLAHLALLSADGMTQVDMGSSPGGTAPPRRLLYGNLVSSPHRLRDLHNKQGLFFLFPDVSIRWRGQYRLEISLVRLSRIHLSGAMSMAHEGSVLARARTRAFDVVPHARYIAPSPTRLTQAFLRQGAPMHAAVSNQSLTAGSYTG